MTYGTRCSKCKNKSERHSKFTEMEVNLTVCHFLLLFYLYIYRY